MTEHTAMARALFGSTPTNLTSAQYGVIEQLTQRDNRTTAGILGALRRLRIRLSVGHLCATVYR